MSSSVNFPNINNKVGFSNEKFSTQLFTIKVLIEMNNALYNLNSEKKKKFNYPTANNNLEGKLTLEVLKMINLLNEFPQIQKGRIETLSTDIKQGTEDFPTTLSCSDEVRKKVQNILEYVENNLEN